MDGIIHPPAQDSGSYFISLPNTYRTEHTHTNALNDAAERPTVTTTAETTVSSNESTKQHVAFCFCLFVVVSE